MDEKEARLFTPQPLPVDPRRGARHCGPPGWRPGPAQLAKDRLRLWRVRRREHSRLGVETESGDGAQVARHIASRLWQVKHHVDAAEVRVRGAEVLRTDLLAETDLA